MFKVEFAGISRLKSVEIEWMFLPEEIKIEYFTDPNLMVWDVAKPWYRLQKRKEKEFFVDRQVF